MQNTYAPEELADMAELAIDRGDRELAAELAVEASHAASQLAQSGVGLDRRIELADAAELAADVAREADPTGKAGDRATRLALHVGELSCRCTEAEFAESRPAAEVGGA